MYLYTLSYLWGEQPIEGLFIIEVEVEVIIGWTQCASW